MLACHSVIVYVCRTLVSCHKPGGGGGGVLDPCLGIGVPLGV